MFASHSYLANTGVQNPLQTDQLSLPVHVWASNLFIQPVNWAEQVNPVRVYYMKIYHGGLNASMAQQLLDR
jgi:hypothetical protein